MITRSAAAAVPTSTGATAAESVRGLAASTHTRPDTLTGRPPALFCTAPTSRAVGEPAEVGRSLLEVGVVALLRLLGQVIEQGCVASQLLDAGQAVVRGVQRRLEHPQRQRRVLEHLAA